MAVKTILITGATGLLGKPLTKLLTDQGHRVRHLSRSKKGSVETFTWDVDRQTIEAGALDGVDTIIHLAGAGVADKRWSPARKKEIIDSRTKSIDLIRRELSGKKHSVRNFISASAIGYYGFGNAAKSFVENDPPGTDFLASVTHQWEQSADSLSTLGIRVAKVRIGVVLSRDGGALQPTVKTVRMFVGAPLGSGKQILSWVHIDDLVNSFVFLVGREDLSGAFNSTAAHPVTNREFTKAVARQLQRPLILPAVPSFALRLALGEMSNIVLEGSKVSSEKIRKAGFTFRFDRIEDAIADLLRRD